MVPDHETILKRLVDGKGPWASVFIQNIFIIFFFLLSPALAELETNTNNTQLHKNLVIYILQKQVFLKKPRMK